MPEAYERYKKDTMIVQHQPSHSNSSITSSVRSNKTRQTHQQNFLIRHVGRTMHDPIRSPVCSRNVTYVMKAYMKNVFAETREPKLQIKFKNYF